MFDVHAVGAGGDGLQTGRPAEGPGPEREAPPAGPVASAGDFLDMAVPVTRHVQITGPSSWKHYISGVDTLDLGFYVDWGKDWPALEKHLDEGKRSAERTQGILWAYRNCPECVILPGGKAPMYAFHLQTPHFHLFIARREKYSEKYPNVYVSPLAKSLWLGGVLPTVTRIKAFIKSLGGWVERIAPSRVDLCADFWIPGGLSFDFLREFGVSRSSDRRNHLDGDKLETFYVGSSGADLTLRIYNKALEVKANGEKLWFRDVWKCEVLEDI